MFKNEKNWNAEFFGLRSLICSYLVIDDDRDKSWAKGKVIKIFLLEITQRIMNMLMTSWEVNKWNTKWIYSDAEIRIYIDLRLRELN